VRSIDLSCPGCFASYEAWFEGPEPPSFRCRFCRSELQEGSSYSSSAPESDEAIGPEGRLELRQGPITDLRVWLDDDLEDCAAPKGWIHVTTAWDAIGLLKTERVVELSLDHDLGDDEANGRGVDVVGFIAEQQEVHGRVLWPRDGITIHSGNPYGRDSMRRTIRRYAPRYRRVSESLSRGGKPVFRFEALPRQKR
jgi:hypothetical protein